MKGVNIRLKNLVKHFGAVKALKTLDLELSGGEMVAFLGPSGCGKTTTLLLIAGIYRPTAGEIYFDDIRIDPLHPRERDIGMVFQSYALYPHLTLFENIAFPLRLKRWPKEEIRAKVGQTAELLGIGEQLQRRPAQVSGGQQQRAALARALVKEPQVLLLDEPLSNLDALIRLQARAEIRRLQQDLGITSILVTHDQSEALAMADRIAVFSVGEVQQ
ncbi:MAG TPA: ATP-binding cassette domain-containing protein, partial [Trueperaceae bacterium]|nr:ATP-binding cassette domain-containing protein [Trueperaceae bacterium]